MASFDAFGFPLCQALNSCLSEQELFLVALTEWDTLQICAMPIFVCCVDRRKVFLLWLPFSGEVAEPWRAKERSHSDIAHL